MPSNALIVGAGSGTSASFARALAGEGHGTALAARRTDKLDPLCRELQAAAHACDFTGASASVKGFVGSAPFAIEKFALRGLAESLARQLQPKGIHVAHFVIDGAVATDGRMPLPDKPDGLPDPDAIAQTYLAVLKQPRSAWSSEVAVRPWVETF